MLRSKQGNNVYFTVFLIYMSPQIPKKAAFFKKILGPPHESNRIIHIAKTTLGVDAYSSCYN